jgi:hypothetical protein
LKIKHFKKQALFDASKEKANSVNTSLRKHVGVAKKALKLKKRLENSRTNLN